MKLSSIRIAGFRGILEELELRIPPGFLVISGRNGSGKSTICNAIEFALRGEFRAIPDHSEKGESLQDYIWWRGLQSAPKRSVSIGISNEVGEEVEITRSSEGSDSISIAEIQKLLCHELASMDDCLEHLCRTTILRDEELVRMSLDMSELERFDFVQSTLGTAGYSEIESKAEEVHTILKSQSDNARTDYSKARDEVSRLVAQISEVRLQAAEPEFVVEAENALRSLLDSQSTDDVGLLEQAASEVARLRSDVDTLETSLERLTELQQRQRELRTQAYDQQVKQYRVEIAEIEEQTLGANRKLEATSHALATYQQDRPEIVSLANLLDHGREYGREEGRCPLCGSSISQDPFDNHLELVEERISVESRSIIELSEERTRMLAEIDNNNLVHRELNERLGKLLGEEEAISSKLKTFREDDALREVSLADDDDLIDTELLASKIDDTRKEIRDLNQAIGTIESSRTRERISNLEQKLKTAREAADESEAEMQRLQGATAKAKDAFDTVRRLIREDLDEQLAELSPLLEEIFFRLKPHSDWRKISYHIRGDVRRFLNLDVGEGVNPSYIFSSGQRRIAGLAFLLAVHLSRWWCKLDTLILDDPVQHVDDFRALHLAETLGAIRRTGRQIICSVEDRDLADVLCRRLRSSADEPGMLVELEYRKGRGVHISSVTDIEPVGENILLAA